MGLNLVYSSQQGGSAFGSCDLDFTAGSELESAVLASLLTWRRVTQQEVESGETRYGWWGDNLTGNQIGSKIWLLQRAKVLPTLTKTAKQYVQDALEWFIDTGVASQIDVQTNLTLDGTSLTIGITIYKNDGSVVKMNYDNLWNKLNKN